MNRAKAVRNELPKVEFEERRTGYKALKYNGYTYVRATTKAYQDGSIMWRCQHSRDQFKCKATCTSIGDTLTRESNVHSCPILTTMDIVYKQAERDILKQIKQVPKSRPKAVFMDNINKATQKLDLDGYSKEEAKALPKWENFRQKAYRARKSKILHNFI